MPGRVGEALLLVPVLRRGREDLDDLPVGLHGAPVGLDAHDAVVEQEVGILVGDGPGVDGEPVDGVGLHRRVAGLGDLWGLGGGRGGEEGGAGEGAGEACNGRRRAGHADGTPG